MQKITQPASAFRLLLVLSLLSTALMALVHGPGSPIPAQAATGPVDAKIQIVWPHNNAPVAEATLANIEAYFLQPGTLTPVAQDFTNTVRLWAALNAEPASRKSSSRATA